VAFSMHLSLNLGQGNSPTDTFSPSRWILGNFEIGCGFFLWHSSSHI
jgi:hypothetical protein